MRSLVSAAVRMRALLSAAGRGAAELRAEEAAPAVGREVSSLGSYSPRAAGAAEAAVEPLGLCGQVCRPSQRHSGLKGPAARDSVVWAGARASPGRTSSPDWSLGC